MLCAMSRELWWYRVLLALGACEIAVTLAIDLGSWAAIFGSVSHTLALIALQRGSETDTVARRNATHLVIMASTSRMIMYSLDAASYAAPRLGVLRIVLALLGSYVCSEVLVDLWFRIGKQCRDDVPPDGIQLLLALASTAGAKEADPETGKSE